MTLTIEWGWWLAPLAVTILAFGRAYWVDRGNSGGGYSFGAIASAFVYGAALIVSLIAWLAWAVLT